MPSLTTSTPTTLPTLLKRYEGLTRELARMETERAAVHDQILAAGRAAAPRKPRPARTPVQAAEVVRDTVRVLREAGAPLPRREVAARLGLKPHAAQYRLDKAVELRFVERLGGGLYRVTNVVPAI
jgi:hypothetical protein